MEKHPDIFWWFHKNMFNNMLASTSFKMFKGKKPQTPYQCVPSNIMTTSASEICKNNVRTIYGTPCVKQ